MRTINRILVLMVAASVFGTACGGSDASSGDGGTDAATSNAGGSSGSSSRDKTGMTLNASTGLSLRDRLLGQETGYVSGLVLVERDDKEMNDAVVSVNGATLPLLVDGFYLADNAPIAQPIAAGSSLSVKATQGGSTAAVDLPCPREVTITSPTENTAVTPGQTLTVSWSGSLDTGALPPGADSFGTLANLFKSWLSFHAYDSAEKKVGLLLVGEPGQGVLEPSATTATITVPDPGTDSLILELNVKGKAVTASNYSGVCDLSRRVLLTVKQ